MSRKKSLEGHCTKRNKKKEMENNILTYLKKCALDKERLKTIDLVC